MNFSKNYILIYLLMFILIPSQLLSNNLRNITVQNTVVQEEVGNLESYVQYNINEQKFHSMIESGRTSVASSFKELQEMLAAAYEHEIIPGLRGDLYIAMYDSWGDGWNGIIASKGPIT